MTRHLLLAVVVAAALLQGCLLELAPCLACEPASPGGAVVLAADGAVGDSAAPAPSTEGLAREDTTAPGPHVAGPDSTAPEPPAGRVVVYYFHRTARCDNCLKFEAYADQALRELFPGELAEGTLEWHVVNLDDTTDAHFVDDYNLAESSLIVTRVLDREEVGWRNLDAIWALVDDKDAFVEYVAFEVGGELTNLGGTRPNDSRAPPERGRLAPGGRPERSTLQPRSQGD